MSFTTTFTVALSKPQPRRKPDSAPTRSARDRTPKRGVIAERLQRRLALAHYIERLIEEGRLRDYAHAAEVLGVSRPRLSQLMDLVLLPVATQEAILMGEVQLSERTVREKWRTKCDDSIQNPSPLIV